jgi:protease I
MNAGAKWIDPNETFSNANVDGNLLTVPAWTARTEWIGKFLELLGSKIGP